LLKIRASLWQLRLKSSIIHAKEIQMVLPDTGDCFLKRYRILVKIQVMKIPGLSI